MEQTPKPDSSSEELSATQVQPDLAAAPEPTRQEGRRAPQAASRLVEPDDPARSGGVRIGRFIVLKALGQGGMGVVYSAYDPELDRKVALKLLHPDKQRLRNSGGHARLLREAQAMARVSHPNVCQVFDVGTHGDHVFLAMEFVDGPTLHEWLQQSRSWREVLELFRQAGQGLAAAHAVGLVHRDFKPSNVLVSKSGRAYVTDFGLARPMEELPEELALEQGGSEPRSGPSLLSSSVTQSGMLMGTPHYMPPEQYVNGGLDARSDQFSLCAALYWALYKQRPFEPKQLANAASEISRNPTLPPTDRSLAASAALLPGSLIREPPADSKVPRWVRQVVLRGLALRPEERFSTMEALLEALAQEPRRRQRQRALAVGGLLVAALGAVAVPLYQQSRVCSGVEQALEEVWSPRAKARLEAAFGATGSALAQESARRVGEVLDRYARAWVEQSVQACRATRVDRVQTEELLSLRTACLAQRQQDLRALVRVLTTGGDDKVVRNAVDAALALPALDECQEVGSLVQRPALPQDPARRAEVERLGEQLAEVKALLDTGLYPRALELAQQQEQPVEATAFTLLRARLYLYLGKALQKQDQLEASSTRYEQALDAAEAAREDRMRVRALVELIFNEGMQGHLEQVAQWERRARAVLSRLGGEALLQRSLEGNLGAVLLAQGRYPQAREHLTRMRELDKQVLPPGDPRQGDSTQNLGLLALETGELEQAQALLGEALRQYEASWGPLNAKVARVHGLLASTLHERGELPQALEHAQKAVEIYTKLLGPKHSKVGDELDGVGMLQLSMKQYDQARKTFEQALEIKREALGPEHMNLSYSYDGIGQALLAAGRAKEAVEPLEKSLSFEGLDPATLAESGFALARALGQVGERARALEEAKRARARFAEVGKQDKAAAVDAWVASLEKDSKPEPARKVRRTAGKRKR